MRESSDLAEVKAAWLSQLKEEVPVNLEHMHGRRMRDLFSTTRSEIIGSVGAALFFAGVVALRFAPERDLLVQFGCAGVIVLAAITAFRFRHYIRRRAPQSEALARTGLEHYRMELLHRRDHLRSVWIWHGPLLLACILAAVTLARRIVPGRLWNVLPLILLLVVRAVIGIRRRLREAAEIQQEIDEISGVSPMGE